LTFNQDLSLLLLLLPQIIVACEASHRRLENYQQKPLQNIMASWGMADEAITKSVDKLKVVGMQ
jgi:hypothetical protein